MRQAAGPNDEQNSDVKFWPDIDIDLSGAFLMSLDFSHCRLRNGEFADTTFDGAGKFQGATFSGDARFLEATFNCDARFQKTTFIGAAEFDGATFNGDALFDEATLRGRPMTVNELANGTMQDCQDATDEQDRPEPVQRQ